MPFPFAAAGLALSAGSLGYSIFGGKRQKQFDISGELGRIGDLYAQARESARAAVNREAALGRRNTADNLAARGVYRSPVAENSFGRLEERRLGAIADVEGSLAGEEARTKAGVLSAGLGYAAAEEDRRMQRTAAIAGGVSSLGNSLLFFGPGATPEPKPATTPFFQPTFLESVAAPLGSWDVTPSAYAGNRYRKPLLFR
jgi:hypothetical protein